MAHKSGKLFFGMDVRGIRTSSQDDAEDAYNLGRAYLSNFGKEFLQIELFACQGFGCESAGDTINIAMVQWYIVLAGLPSRVWIAWTDIQLETGDGLFQSGQKQPLFSRR